MSDREIGQTIAKRFFPVNRSEAYEDLTDQIANALADERERCAKVALDHMKTEPGCWMVVRDIRELG